MNSVLKRILWRLLAGVGVLWGAATLAFLTISLSGGDTALAVLGHDAMPTPEVLARVRADYHLDQPIYRQYLGYLARVAHGDLGESYRLRIPVARAIGQQIGATAELALGAGVVAILASVTIALSTARRANWIRGTFSNAELVGSSTPGFVVGILLLLLFSFRLHWLPASGQQGWKALILPVLTLAIPMVAVMTQVLRHALEEVLDQPFIITARARGMSEAGVRVLHALRHALVPLVTLAGNFFGMLLGGVVIAETLFAREGVGRLVADATTNKDVPLVLGVTLLSASVYVLVNLAVDLINTAFDYRARPA